MKFSFPPHHGQIFLTQKDKLYSLVGLLSVLLRHLAWAKCLGASVVCFPAKLEPKRWALVCLLSVVESFRASAESLLSKVLCLLSKLVCFLARVESLRSKLWCLLSKSVCLLSTAESLGAKVWCLLSVLLCLLSNLLKTASAEFINQTNFLIFKF